MAFERYSQDEALEEAAKIQEKAGKVGGYQEAERQVEQEYARKNLTERATDLILQRYGGSEGEIKAFHNTTHTEGVRQRAGEILKTIQETSPETVTDGELALVDIIAALHDADIETLEPVPQKHDIAERDAEGKKILGPDNRPIIKRKIELTHLKRPLGVNEGNSIKLLKEWLEEVNTQRREAGVKEVFTEADLKAAEDAVRATIPGFDTTIGTVVPLAEVSEKSFTYQQAKQDKERLGLKPLESPLEIALSLADLGEAAINPEEFETAGINNFIEDHSGWIEKIGAAKAGQEMLTEEDREDLAWILKGFLEIQPGFAAGRLKNSEALIQRLPEAARPALQELMGKTAQSIEKSKKVFDDVKGMNLDQLLAHFPLLRNKVQEAADRVALGAVEGEIDESGEEKRRQEKAA